MSVTLITIPASHYCEKARWALQRAGVPFKEVGHLPVISRWATRRAGKANSVPVLVNDADGKTLWDSTDILKWVDEQVSAERRLFPVQPDLAKEVERWEEDFDQIAGPHARRLGYGYLLPHRTLALQAAVQGVPLWERISAQLLFPIFARYLKKGLRIDRRGMERSEEKLQGIFARVNERLHDGRRYLVGDRFTAADLTFAALVGPVIFPEQYGSPLPSVASFPSEIQGRVQKWREQPAGEFARRLYREDR